MPKKTVVLVDIGYIADAVAMEPEDAVKLMQLLQKATPVSRAGGRYSDCRYLNPQGERPRCTTRMESVWTSEAEAQDEAERLKMLEEQTEANNK